MRLAGIWCINKVMRELAVGVEWGLGCVVPLAYLVLKGIAGGSTLVTGGGGMW